VTGAVLGDRYQLDHLIGRGGMAAVWSATDTVLGRPVAIKRLHPGMLADEEHAERFRREALLVARLSHPNLVRLLDRGEDPEGPYLVMELVEGENLKSRIRREGALEPEEAARICGCVGEALAYAHGQGVVHRDIKAQNVLLTRDGEVKLADFGIARVVEGEDGEGLTKTDMLLGSADYLSPEQADGRPVDGRADIYSLGILLYECLTGTLPFKGEGFVAVAMKHCSEPLPDPRLVRRDVPDHLAAVAMHAAAKDPGDRFPDAASMVAALEGRPGGTAVFTMPPLPSEDEGATARHPRRRRRRIFAWALALVAIAAIGMAAYAYFEPVGDSGAPPVPTAVPLTLSAVRDYDPQGDGQEQPNLRGYAIDVDPTTGQPNPTTAWYTERYYNDAAFGGSGKTGVGLILRLTAPAVATEMRISSPTPGAAFEVLGPLVDGRRQTLAKGMFSGADQVVKLAKGPPAEAYVLWITSLVEDGEGGYSAGVGQVELRGTPNQD
jgi:serine/threonine protein kinase